MSPCGRCDRRNDRTVPTRSVARGTRSRTSRARPARRTPGPTSERTDAGTPGPPPSRRCRSRRTRWSCRSGSRRAPGRGVLTDRPAGRADAPFVHCDYLTLVTTLSLCPFAGETRCSTNRSTARKTSLRGLRLPVLGVGPGTHACGHPSTRTSFALTAARAARKVRFRSMFPPKVGCAK